MTAHIDPEAINDATDLLVEEWHTGHPQALDQYAERAVCALIERRDLLVRLLGIPRPGPCAHSPIDRATSWPAELGEPPWCSLDAGHTGCHKYEEQGTVWREAS